MLNNYKNFGDVVLYDTTFKTNRFNFPLGVFCGITNNRKNCFFGLVLLNEETESSFTRAFNIFINIHGKQPKAFISDMDKAIIASGKKTFTLAKHSICEWHLVNNIKKNISYLNKNKQLERICSDVINLIYSDNYEQDYNLIITNEKLKN